jgi:transposase
VQAEIEKLRLLIRQLQRGQFGRRSEKFDPDQLTRCAGFGQGR